jgi:hypothetical protein
MDAPHQLIVQLDNAPADADEVVGIAGELGVTLEPQHPHTPDQELSRFLSAPLEDVGTGEQLAERLNAMQGVSAFVKPSPTGA